MMLLHECNYKTTLQDIYGSEVQHKKIHRKMYTKFYIILQNFKSDLNLSLKAYLSKH